jgi:bifunctional UDP-N-acetylglucosamine pyrophosphorylase/glucosamine-1-phosphate N-acetyltransferase|nr:NTP transferase domain-containing protein [Candidatus Krumholzibacteria bacterium]
MEKVNLMNLDAVVLAAGKGTRMKSDLPKVLHPLAGRPLLDHVLDTVGAVGVDHTVVVVGHKADLVKETCARPGIEFALQQPQLGTGHAVQVTVDQLRRGGFCVVLAGDVPLLTVATLQRLLDEARRSEAAAIILTCVVEDAAAYGRIIKDDSGQVLKIVEARDATPEELAVGEYNTGILCFRTELMIEALANLTTDNDQGEYYLTDTVAWLVGRGHRVEAVATEDPDEVGGINTVDELAAAELVFNKRSQ